MAHRHDRPPGRGTAPGWGTGAVDQSSGQAARHQDRTSGWPDHGLTARYLQSREAVLGRRFILHQEPAIAAALLTEQLGPLGARQWLRRVLEEVSP